MVRDMNKLTAILGIVAIATGGLSSIESASANGRGDGPVIYVTSQGLYYDSIVVADPLPQKGPFQLLSMGMNGLETEYGPGQPGHVGGRWWLDLNGNGMQDSEDKFFLCPLLGPGRETP